MGPLLAVITHSLLNDYVLVEQPSVGAVNCSLLSSKNRLSDFRRGRGRESALTWEGFSFKFDEL